MASSHPRLAASRHAPGPRNARTARAARLRSPLLIAFAVILAFESAGGIVIFCARLAYGTTPGEALHVIGGVVLTGLYAAYQWRHWLRVRPVRQRLDYALGILATASLILTQASGWALGITWWQSREGTPEYAPVVSGLHNIGNMLVLTFVAAHVGAVFQRARRIEEDDPGA